MQAALLNRPGGWIALAAFIAGCIVLGAALVKSPMLVGAAAVVAVGVLCLILKFEVTVIVLLVLRSSLDPFSSFGLTGALALLIDAVTVIYLLTRVLARKPIQGDWLWGVLALFIALMGFWPLAMAQGWLGHRADAAMLGYPTLGEDSLREWIRILSYAMIYGLAMQLKGRIAPERLLSLIMLSLVVPLTVAFLQMFANGALPPLMQTRMEGRVFGTVSHPDTFVLYLLLMMGLSWWRFRLTGHWRWLVLMAVLVIPYTGTKTLGGLGMAAVFLAVLLLPRLNAKTIIGGAIAVALVLGSFTASPAGQERLESLRQTPIFNGQLDVNSAVHLASVQNNSFVWRLAQWTYLINAWQRAPVLGHGLNTSTALSPFHNGAHNDYVRALAETGLVGLVLYLGLWAAVLTRLVGLWRASPRDSCARELRLVLIAVCAALLLGSLTNHLWETTTFYFYWWTAVAVAGWTFSEKTRHDPHPRPLSSAQ
ncbi:O-antigen ligase family protein [Gloeobacter morelensis]|uniref:O-antigen ligase family protein n=1 Tax=Gloeobacter morelensis MG652769 TaxID=2781736 RepID=A0ABY3PSA4_9CYAN|nr:O-antigen ligase family protein [Gloeobacter morelensis]UFP96570.1 O-antigen ligase family protein [Gloeobacter morelensis MG652769]